MRSRSGNAALCIIIALALAVIAGAIYYYFFVNTDTERNRVRADERSETGTNRVILEGRTAIQSSPRGNLVAVGYANGNIRVYRCPPSLSLHWVADGARVHRAPVTSLSFSPDGLRLASADSSGRVLLWPIAQGNDPAWDAWEIMNLEERAMVSYLHDGRLMVVGQRARVMGLHKYYEPDVGWIVRPINIREVQFIE